VKTIHFGFVCCRLVSMSDFAKLHITNYLKDAVSSLHQESLALSGPVEKYVISVVLVFELWLI
jgi:hypothetical protein